MVGFPLEICRASKPQPFLILFDGKYLSPHSKYYQWCRLHVGQQTDNLVSHNSVIKNNMSRSIPRWALGSVGQAVDMVRLLAVRERCLIMDSFHIISTPHG